jgi:tetratricopeptide (TPR) repeat protein
MSESLDKLSNEDINLIQGLFEPLNKNPLNSEALNPMASVFRQKMGYAEPVNFSDPEGSGAEDTKEFSDSDEVADDLWSNEEGSDDDTSDSNATPPSFKSFDDDEIDLDELLAEPSSTSESEVDPPTNESNTDLDFGNDNDPFANEEPLSNADDDIFSDLGAAPSQESDTLDDFPTLNTPNETESLDSNDDMFGDLSEPKSEPKELDEDPFGNFGDTTPVSNDADTDPFNQIDEPSSESNELDDDMFGGLDTPKTDSVDADDDMFGGFGETSSDSNEMDSDPFGDLGEFSSDKTTPEEDPFGDLGGTASESSDIEEDPFGGIDTSSTMEDEPSSMDDNDPFGDMGVDLTSASQDQSYADIESNLDSMDDMEPPDINDIGGSSGEGVLEDELSSLMDQDEGGLDASLSDEDLAIIQREIVKYPPKLRRLVIEAIVNARIPAKNQKELLELIKHQQKAEDIAEYLSGVFGEEVSLFDRSKPYSDDGVPIISTRPIYTKEGALKQRKLIRNTIFASAAAILFVVSFISLYKYVIIPGRASSYYEEGLSAIRLYNLEKDQTEKKKLLREAKEMFIKGEEIHPHDLKYLNAYGVEYSKVGRYEESFEMLFGKVEPPFPDWSKRKEVPYISISEDSSWSDEGIEISGIIQNPDRKVYLTSQDRQKRRILKAGAYILTRVKDDIHHIPTYINLGRFHSQNSKDFMEGEKSKTFKNDILAIEYYKRVFTDANTPDSIEARAGIAKIYYNNKEFPKSAAEYNKIIEIYPKDPIGHGGILSSYIEIWKRDKNPQFILNHHRMIKNQLGIEEDLSLFILSKLASFYIDLDPEETRVRYNVNPEDQVTEMDIDDNAEFLLDTIFSKEEEQNGVTIQGNKYAEGYYQRGRYFLKKKEALRAMKQFELCSSYDNSHYPSVLRMAEYYMGVLDFPEAENLLKNSEKRYLDFRDSYGRRDEDETLVEGDPAKLYFDRGKIIYLQSSGILESDLIREFPARKIYPNRSLVKLPEKEMDRRRGLLTAQVYFAKALEAPNALKDEKSIREMIYFQGWIDYMLGDFEKAINTWSELGEEDIYFNTSLMLGFGNSSYYTNQLNSALSNYLKVMEDFEAKETKIKRIVEDDQDHQEIYQTLVAVYNNIGAVYERKQDYVTALTYYWKAIESARKIQLVSEMANSNKDLLMKKERLGQMPLLEDWLAPTLDPISTLIQK